MNLIHSFSVGVLVFNMIFLPLPAPKIMTSPGILEKSADSASRQEISRRNEEILQSLQAARSIMRSV